MRKELTDVEQKDLDEILITDILERYNRSEYWDEEIIREFYTDCEVEL